MGTATELKFHKRMPGLYGTSVWRSTAGRFEFLGCNYGCTDVEVCVDGHTDSDGWYVRYVCAHDHFTDTLGEWFLTLRDAKAWMMANPERVS